MQESTKCYFSLSTEDKRPHKTPVFVRVLAGSTTGILAVAVAHPTDVVKVRMQAQFGNNLGRYANSTDAYKKIFNKEGMKGLWRGNGKSLSPSLSLLSLSSSFLHICMINV